MAIPRKNNVPSRGRRLSDNTNSNPRGDRKSGKDKNQGEENKAFQGKRYGKESKEHFSGKPSGKGDFKGKNQESGKRNFGFSKGEKSSDRVFKRGAEKDNLNPSKSYGQGHQKRDNAKGEDSARGKFQREKSSRAYGEKKQGEFFDKDFTKDEGKSKPYRGGYRKDLNENQNDFSDRRSSKKQRDSDGYKPKAAKQPKIDDGLIRLNRYLANSGICSRREADEFIRAGAVSVNGIVITEMGHKVSLDDVVKYGGALISPEKPVYLLLNKPKGFITTVSDPRDRKTVMSLIAGACKERVVPVGRLDRNTTGLLLFTNDGDLLKKLTHPKHGVSKIYHVTTDTSIKSSDMLKMVEGIELEDGIAKADNVSYVDSDKTKKEIGIELHSGKNRVVRRMIASLGYEVLSLDRVYFAGLTKKNLPRGQYRFLTEKEVNFLKMLS
jgi:23S rRNA pseudouridine2605 synthase